MLLSSTWSLSCAWLFVGLDQGISNPTGGEGATLGHSTPGVVLLDRFLSSHAAVLRKSSIWNVFIATSSVCKLHFRCLSNKYSKDLTQHCVTIGGLFVW